jgi:hypothetical protein
VPHNRARSYDRYFRGQDVTHNQTSLVCCWERIPCRSLPKPTEPTRSLRYPSGAIRVKPRITDPHPVVKQNSQQLSFGLPVKGSAHIDRCRELYRFLVVKTQKERRCGGIGSNSSA